RHRQDDGERVLGEALLAAEDDDEEIDGIAELRNERTPGSVRQQGAQEALADQREAHREPGRQPGEEERAAAALELVAPFAIDGFVDDAGMRRAALLGFLRELLRRLRQVLRG